MFCCLYKYVSIADYYYGILDTSDGKVEEYRGDVLSALLQRGVNILGLRLDGKSLKYTGKDNNKYAMTDYFEHNGCVAVINISSEIDWDNVRYYKCWVSIFKKGIDFVKRVYMGESSKCMELGNICIDPKNKDVIRITFTPDDVPYHEGIWGERWERLRIDTKTCKYQSTAELR